ncbi:MAG: hypothetical protein IAE77_27025 [Prosthecobacter sp.]|jgi:hypothetical protein|uniref:hypothetical protein n=1 Tax=Prosthecobacter sp. TaxID=1965333 RepID=UPI001A028C17|nr:hypothetical protein [Prosthecobacter sp.]MBE2287138.1 hypothetical protein [Prosthecobacter sp.]
MSPYWTFEYRDSVVECGGKPRRDAAVACRTASFGRGSFLLLPTAVSSMPDGSGISATALHDADATY